MKYAFQEDDGNWWTKATTEMAHCARLQYTMQLTMALVNKRHPRRCLKSAAFVWDALQRFWPRLTFVQMTTYGGTAQHIPEPTSTVTNDPHKSNRIWQFSSGAITKSTVTNPSVVVSYAQSISDHPPKLQTQSRLGRSRCWLIADTALRRDMTIRC